MRILVTGTEGYLGHVFAPTLLNDGHDVVAVDTGFYREAQLYRGVDRQAHTLFKDIRRVDHRRLRRCRRNSAHGGAVERSPR